MTSYRAWIVVPIIAVLGLAGCVAYEPGYRHHGGAYYAPAPVRVAPAPRYWGGPPRHHGHHDYRHDRRW